MYNCNNDVSSRFWFFMYATRFMQHEYESNERERKVPRQSFFLMKSSRMDSSFYFKDKITTDASSSLILKFHRCSIPPIFFRLGVYKFSPLQRQYDAVSILWKNMCICNYIWQIFHILSFIFISFFLILLFVECLQYEFSPSFYSFSNNFFVTLVMISRLAWSQLIQPIFFGQQEWFVTRITGQRRFFLYYCFSQRKLVRKFIHSMSANRFSIVYNGSSLKRFQGFFQWWCKLSNVFDYTQFNSLAIDECVRSEISMISQITWCTSYRLIATVEFVFFILYIFFPPYIDVRCTSFFLVFVIELQI